MMNLPNIEKIRKREVYSDMQIIAAKHYLDKKIEQEIINCAESGLKSCCIYCYNMKIWPIVLKEYVTINLKKAGYEFMFIDDIKNEAEYLEIKW